ncbi:hypothetical protein OYC64_020946 [Pagothenia borchgrevinki]|uniref:Uncharacterized protein n=1 Tax=Pagothenia borchgrevinki TaxID=8213 RepID=A0ABD2FN34_PAGBO
MSKPADLGVVPKKKPAAAAMSKPADLGAVPKEKEPAAAAMSKPADLGVVPKKKPAAEVSGASSETQSLINSTRKLTLNLQAPQDQSAAPVQIKKIKVITLLRTTKTNTHLQVQLEGRFLEAYGTTRVLSEGMDFTTVEQFKKGFPHLLPLVVMANMQGKKILEMSRI